MPSADQHRKKVENNRAFLATISRDEFTEWAVVVAFYTAVHLLERVRAASGHGDSFSHDDRSSYVLHEHITVHEQYHELLNASMLARYRSRGDFFAHFQPDTLDSGLLLYLTEIEKYVAERLGT